MFCPNCGSPVRKPAAPQGFIPAVPVQAPAEPQEAIPAVNEAVEAAAAPVAETVQPAVDSVEEAAQAVAEIPQAEIPEVPAEMLREEIPQVEIPQEAAPAFEAAQDVYNAAQAPEIPQPEAVPYIPEEVPQNFDPNANYYPPQDPNANYYPPQDPNAWQPPQEAVPPYPPQNGQPPVKQKKEKGQKKSFFKSAWFYIILAAVLLIAAGVVLFFVLGGKTTYDLKDYLKVEYDGYEGKGEVYVSIDTSALTDKIYEDQKISLDDISSLSGMPKMIQKASDIDEALRTIDVTATPNSNLKNGDEVTVTFEFDNEVAKKQKMEFIGEPQTITVEGLPSLKELDPFAGLSVTFKGISGDGEAVFEYNGTDDLLSEYAFDIQGDAKQYYLKNGDEITVAVESYYDDDTAAYYGFKITKREQNYTVSGLNEYIGEFSQISAAGLELLRTRAAEDLNDALDDIDAAYTVGEPEYAGYAIGIANSEDEYTKNYLYLIYKAKIGAVAGKTMPATLYMPVKFDNITDDDELGESYAYGVKGYARLIGSSDYFSGYFDPYSITKEIKETYPEYTFTFGDGFEAYDTDPVGVTAFSDIPQETLTAATEYVIARAKAYVKDNYESTTKVSDYAGVGEYIFVAKDKTTDIEDRSILVTVVKMKVVDEEKKINTVLYMPFEFDGLLKTGDGIYCLSYGSDIFSNDELAEGYETAGMKDLKTLDTLMQGALTETYECTPSETMKKAVG